MTAQLASGFIGFVNSPAMEVLVDIENAIQFNVGLQHNLYLIKSSEQVDPIEHLQVLDTKISLSVDRNNQRVEIYNESNGEDNIFYYRDARSIVYSNQFELILKFCSNLQIDKQSLADLVLVNAVIPPHTIFKQIKRITKRSKLKIEKDELQITALPINLNLSHLSDTEMVFEKEFKAFNFLERLAKNLSFPASLTSNLFDLYFLDENDVCNNADIRSLLAEELHYNLIERKFSLQPNIINKHLLSYCKINMSKSTALKNYTLRLHAWHHNLVESFTDVEQLGFTNGELFYICEIVLPRLAQSKQNGAPLNKYPDMKTIFKLFNWVKHSDQKRRSRLNNFLKQANSYDSYLSMFDVIPKYNNVKHSIVGDLFYCTAFHTKMFSFLFTMGYRYTTVNHLIKIICLDKYSVYTSLDKVKINNV